MIHRRIQSTLQKSTKSILLLGPRQVGKSTLIRALKPELEVNLADELQYLQYSSQAGAFKFEVLESQAQSILVDEIQRIPTLLNTIQSIVDVHKHLKFYLTGSSARKLKRGQANLLPGRVFQFKLGPLVAAELNYQMNTLKALQAGTLPEIYLTEDPKIIQRALRSYSAGYLKEEIQAEALVRNLESFARFLYEVTTQVAEFVDFTKLAQRSKISRFSIPRYFEILEDTLVGYRVYPFSRVSESVDLVKHPKFYFFDNGVYNGLLGNFVASADRIGKLSEQLVFGQLLHSAWAAEKEIRISSFRTRSGLEVDFIVELDGELFAVEVKASGEVSSSDLDGLKALPDCLPRGQIKRFVLHMQTQEKKYGDIAVLPWQKGLKEMGL